MNLNGDEKRIRQLFREMSCEDESRTPEFAVLVAAARSRAGRTKKGSRLFAFGLVVSVAIVLLIALSLALRQPVRQTQDEPSDQVAQEKQPGKQSEKNPEKQSTESAPGKTAPGSSVSTGGTIAQQGIPRRVRRKRHSDDLAIRMKTLFAWQSPTASLLKAPGDEMLKSLPRLGDSLQSIKIFSPNEFN